MESGAAVAEQDDPQLGPAPVELLQRHHAERHGAARRGRPAVEDHRVGAPVDRPRAVDVVVDAVVEHAGAAAVALDVEVAQPWAARDPVEALAVGIRGPPSLRRRGIELGLVVVDEVRAGTRATELEHREDGLPSGGDDDVRAVPVVEALVEGRLDRREVLDRDTAHDRRPLVAALPQRIVHPQRARMAHALQAQHELEDDVVAPGSDRERGDGEGDVEAVALGHARIRRQERGGAVAVHARDRGELMRRPARRLVRDRGEVGQRRRFKVRRGGVGSPLERQRALQGGRQRAAVRPERGEHLAAGVVHRRAARPGDRVAAGHVVLAHPAAVGGDQRAHVADGRPHADRLDVPDRLAQAAVLVEVAAQELERRVVVCVQHRSSRRVGLPPPRVGGERAPERLVLAVRDVGEAQLRPAGAPVGRVDVRQERRIVAAEHARRAAVGGERRRRTRPARARSSGSCPAAEDAARRPRRRRRRAQGPRGRRRASPPSASRPGSERPRSPPASARRRGCACGRARTRPPGSRARRRPRRARSRPSRRTTRSRSRAPRRVVRAARRPAARPGSAPRP